jgi:excisionase family DNA binding protein
MNRSWLVDGTILLLLGSLFAYSGIQVRIDANGTWGESAVTERLAFGIEEVAKALGTSRDTVERLIARRELISFVIGRRRFVSAEALGAFVREREEQSAGLR